MLSSSGHACDVVVACAAEAWPGKSFAAFDGAHAESDLHFGS